jgi:hypothetical protein
MSEESSQLAVWIVRFVDQHFPGWVECEFIDAEGRRHTVRDKVPVFTTVGAGEKEHQFRRFDEQRSRRRGGGTTLQ